MSLAGLPEYSIYANEGGDEHGNLFAWLNIGGPNYHLIIQIGPDDLDKLPKAWDARWDDRTTQKIGVVHTSPAFWSVRGDELSILIGHDDESWAIAFSLPATTLGMMIEKLKPLRQYLQGGQQTS
jgi:hypothetical protein